MPTCIYVNEAGGLYSLKKADFACTHSSNDLTEIKTNVGKDTLATFPEAPSQCKCEVCAILDFTLS